MFDAFFPLSSFVRLFFGIVFENDGGESSDDDDDDGDDDSM